MNTKPFQDLYIHLKRSDIKLFNALNVIDNNIQDANEALNNIESATTPLLVDKQSSYTLTTVMSDVPELSLRLTKSGLWLVILNLNVTYHNTDGLVTFQLVTNGIRFGANGLISTVQTLDAELQQSMTWIYNSPGIINIKIQAMKNLNVNTSSINGGSTNFQAVYIG
ncbi:MAG TPA: hypothetical protein VNX68_01625 [Nitrosopumilaceae archaeon]|jgi:hypothetical protein|nr:hypothetical protein [Nitrosopumilaceae archaeon]